MKSLIAILLVSLPILGVADSAYLTYEKLVGAVPACGPGFDCGAVLNSAWSSIGPIPLSAFGMAYYLVIFGLGILNFLEADARSLNRLLKLPYNFKPINFLQLVSGFGLLFSLYLIFIMGVVLQAWCQFCLISAAISTLIFLTVFAKSKIENEPPALIKWLWYQVFGFVYQLTKKVLFLFDPETVHETIAKMGQIIGSIPGGATLTSWFFAYKNQSIKKTLAGINFDNPVGLSAGFDYDGKLTGIIPSIGFGFHTIGTVTLEPYVGNPSPAYTRLISSKALIVNKGLKNSGAQALIKKFEKLEFKIPTGISIASTNKLFKNTKAQILDIVTCFYLFDNSKVSHSYYELNISCPNTFGGEPFTTPERLEPLLLALKKLNLKKPIFVKMPIDLNEHETVRLLKVCDKHQVTGVIFGNLTKDKNNQALTPGDRKVWQNTKGNVSGKPTWEKSNKYIKITKQMFGNRFVIIGTGGIFSPSDAQKKIELGADLVQLITGMIFQGPGLISSINLHLSQISKNSS